MSVASRVLMYITISCCRQYKLLPSVQADAVGLVISAQLITMQGTALYGIFSNVQFCLK